MEIGGARGHQAKLARHPRKGEHLPAIVGAAGNLDGIAAQTAEALQAATLAPDHVLRGIRL